MCLFTFVKYFFYEMIRHKLKQDGKKAVDPGTRDLIGLANRGDLQLLLVGSINKQTKRSVRVSRKFYSLTILALRWVNQRRLSTRYGYLSSGKKAQSLFYLSITGR